MDITEEIKRRLAELSPTSMTIQDDSALHAGHKGNNGGGHYQLIITSASFNTLSPVARHRVIYDLLADLIPSKIHALSIDARPITT